MPPVSNNNNISKNKSSLVRQPSTKSNGNNGSRASSTNNSRRNSTITNNNNNNTLQDASLGVIPQELHATSEWNAEREPIIRNNNNDDHSNNSKRDGTNVSGRGVTGLLRSNNNTNNNAVTDRPRSTPPFVSSAIGVEKVDDENDSTTNRCGAASPTPISDRGSWMRLAVNISSFEIENNNNNNNNNNSSDSSAVRLGSVVFYLQQLWRVRYFGPVRFANHNYSNNNNTNNTQSSLTNRLATAAASTKNLYLGLELLQPRDEVAIDRDKIFSDFYSKEELNYFTIDGRQQRKNAKNNLLVPHPILMGSSSYEGTEYFSCGGHNSFVIMTPVQNVFSSNATTATVPGNTDNNNNTAICSIQINNDDEKSKVENQAGDIYSQAVQLAPEVFVEMMEKEKGVNSSHATTAITPFKEKIAALPSGDENNIAGNPQQQQQQQQQQFSPSPTNAALSATALARGAIQRLIDLMERRSLHDEELLREVLDEVARPPQNLVQVQQANAFFNDSFTSAAHNNNNNNPNGISVSETMPVASPTPPPNQISQQHHPLDARGTTDFKQQVEDAIALAHRVNLMNLLRFSNYNPIMSADGNSGSHSLALSFGVTGTPQQQCIISPNTNNEAVSSGTTAVTSPIDDPDHHSSQRNSQQQKNPLIASTMLLPSGDPSINYYSGSNINFDQSANNNNSVGAAAAAAAATAARSSTTPSSQNKAVAKRFSFQSDRIENWMKKLLALESTVLADADAARHKIARVPDSALEIARRLSFDAEDLLRSREEAARERGDVRGLQTGAMAAVRCLATACEIVSAECDPATSRVLEFQKEFVGRTIAAATSSLVELKHERERLASVCFHTCNGITAAKTEAHGSAEKSISDFALMQYKLKTKLAEAKTEYDDTVAQEKDAMKRAMDALELLEAAGRRRVDAADRLRTACASLSAEKSAFAESLNGLRGAEQHHSDEELVAARLLEAVAVPCEAMHSDTERATKEAEADVRSLARSSWMALHQEHAACHRTLMRSAGDLFFRHRARITAAAASSAKQQQQQQDRNKTDAKAISQVEIDEMKEIEDEVSKADSIFKRVSLEALQAAGILWVDPENEVRLLLEEKAEKLIRGIRNNNAKEE